MITLYYMLLYNYLIFIRKHKCNRDMFIGNEDLEKKSTIQISEDLRNTLRDLGTKGESYEDVLWRLVHTKNRRHGDLCNIEELKKIDEELIDETLERFNYNLQDLQAELYIYNEEINTEEIRKEINTEEIRSILKGIEYLCDNIDDLNKNKIKK
jgi:predicted CopG family antitoxin